MNEQVSELIKAYFHNLHVIASVFTMSSHHARASAASLLCAYGCIADGEKVMACRKILRSQERMFSPFRAETEPFTTAALTISNQPEARMKRVQHIFCQAESDFPMLSNQSYLILTAVIMDELYHFDRIPAASARARALYDRAKVHHPFLTGTDDAPYLAILALSAKDDEALIDETEAIYAPLHEWLTGEAAQSISHLYALSPRPVKEKVERLEALEEILAAAGRKLPRDIRIIAPASLMLLDAAPKKIADDLLEIDGLMHEEKEYRGLFSSDKRSRLSHAAMLTAAMYAGSGSPALYTYIPAAVSAAAASSCGIAFAIKQAQDAANAAT